MVKVIVTFMRKDSTFTCDFCEKKTNELKIQGWYYLLGMEKRKSLHFCSRDCLQFFVVNNFGNIELGLKYVR